MRKTIDDRLRDDVIHELAWQRDLESRGITVTSRHGIITLTGHVTSYAQKLAAAEAAHRVAGVLDVANDIDVLRPGDDKHSDPEIAEAIRRLLEWEAIASPTKVETTVSDGIVSLTGEVPSTEDRVKVARAVRSVAGVLGVIDNLRIASEALQVEAIEQAIRCAFERHARRDADHVEIEIRDGVATLTGSVHSWAERQVVIGAARGTRGVRDVVDRITVDPYNTHHG